MGFLYEDLFEFIPTNILRGTAEDGFCIPDACHDALKQFSNAVALIS